MTAHYRIHLINPPSIPGTLANREGAAGMGVVYPDPKAFCYPPHTLAVAAASLRDQGYQVRAFDAVVAEPLTDMEQADAIGVFVSYASLDADLAFITQLRSRTGAKLIAFGPAMRFVADDVLTRAPVDVVLVGEAEGFFGPAFRFLMGQEGQTSPQQLTPQDVQVSGFDSEGLLLDLDTLPFPAWDLLPYPKYSLLTVMSSRGCPDPCTFCPYAAAQGHRFRTRSVENVLSELEYVETHFHPARLIFRDPVFARSRQRVVDLCTGMQKHKLTLRWECESRPEHFDPELLRLMHRAGCQWVKIGLETTDKDVLQRIRRVPSAEEAQAYLQRVADVVRACNEIGLGCRLFVMAGLPGQNTAMAESTGRFIEQVRPSAVNVKLCDKYPGTGLPASSGEQDHQTQMQILQRAQKAILSDGTSPSVLSRGRSWLGRRLRGGKRA
jgi:anaerobic magnesium-protoporphyrin IX monomethyl ester cyclase